MCVHCVLSVRKMFIMVDGKVMYFCSREHGTWLAASVGNLTCDATVPSMHTGSICMCQLGQGQYIC